jgi:hypothetical protein
MKRFFKAWMIIAVTAVIAVGLADCDLDGDDDGGFSWPAELNNTLWNSESYRSFTFYKDSNYGTSLIVSGRRYTITDGSGDGTAGEFTTEGGGKWTYEVTGTGADRTMVLAIVGSDIYNLTYTGEYTPIN